MNQAQDQQTERTQGDATTNCHPPAIDGDDATRTQCADERADFCRQQLEACLQRAIAKGKLELLSEEEIHPHQPENADQVGGNRSAEGRDPEQPDVDQGGFQIQRLRANHTINAIPTTSIAHASVFPSPEIASSLTPAMNAMIPTSESATLRRSIGPGFGLRDLRSAHQPMPMITITMGTLTKNTEPHQKCSSRTPPSNGPSPPPAAATAAHTPIAKLRSLASGKVWRRTTVWKA